jgi:hypothetical protein
MRSPRFGEVALGAIVVAAVAEAALVHLGRTYGSTPGERRRVLPGDDIVADAQVVTNHAITINAPPRDVWPWLVQMGWGRGGWYTARAVDRLLFPDNGPSADAIVREFQQLDVGDFIPDGPPDAHCGFIVERIDAERVLVLHSTSHLPASWRPRAQLDWSWVFVLTPEAEGTQTRFLFRSRWRTAPWWLTAGGRFGIVPADFVMARSMLQGIRARAEQHARPHMRAVVSA